jgi:hypothetical protein
MVTKEAFLAILDVRSEVAIKLAGVIKPEFLDLENDTPIEDDSVVPPFEPNPQPLNPKPVEKFLDYRLTPPTNQYDINLLKEMGFTVAGYADVPNERPKIYITDKGIKLVLARGQHGEYGINGPAINKTPPLIELFNECDYWVHARYRKGEKGLVDGAAFDIRGSKLEGQGGDIKLVSNNSKAVLDHRDTTWFKIIGLDSIQVVL